MKAKAHFWVAGIAAISISVMASEGARAESPSAALNITADSLANHTVMTDQNRWIAQPAKRSLQWNEKGHWGLKLDMNEPVGRDMQLGDVQAGAYYRITPSLRVGGAVALGDAAAVQQQPSDRLLPPQSQAPRVRLETSFKF